MEGRKQAGSTIGATIALLVGMAIFFGLIVFVSLLL